MKGDDVAYVLTFILASRQRRPALNPAPYRTTRFKNPGCCLTAIEVRLYYAD